MFKLVIILLFACIQSNDTLKCLHNGDAYNTIKINPAIYCKSGANPNYNLIVGDFNGDGRADWFCDDPSSVGNDNYAITEISGTIFQTLVSHGTKKWCDNTIGRLITADIDGNGRDDLICRYNDDSRYEVSYYNGHGFSSAMQTYVSFACDGVAQELLIGDVNGDRSDDFICHDKPSGALIIHYNSNHFRGRRHNYDNYNHDQQYQKAPLQFTFCQGSSKSLVLGDVNGDRIKDLICHDPTDGKVEISLGSRSHSFHNKKEFALGFCLASTTDPTHFRVMDINGDRLEDLICLTYPAAGTLVNEDIILSDSKQNFDTPSYNHPNVFDPFSASCTIENLRFADANGDKMVDAICDGIPLSIEYSVCIGL